MKAIECGVSSIAATSKREIPISREEGKREELDNANWHNKKANKARISMGSGYPFSSLGTANTNSERRGLVKAAIVPILIHLFDLELKTV